MAAGAEGSGRRTRWTLGSLTSRDLSRGVAIVKENELSFSNPDMYVFHSVLVGFLGFLLAAATQPGVAQEGRTTLSAVVVDAQSGAPVPNARVEAVGVGVLATTDQQGVFYLPGVPVVLRIEIRRLGYHPLGVTLNLTLEPEGMMSDTTRLPDALPMRANQIELPELVVEAADPWIDVDFTFKGSYRRQNLVSRTEIEKMPYHMDVMLDRAIGVRRNNCPFDYYVDGKIVPGDFVGSNVYNRNPIDFSSIEVYTLEGVGARSPGRSNIPCGVIRLWSVAYEVEHVAKTRRAIRGSRSDAAPPGYGDVSGRVIDSLGRPVGGVIVTLLDDVGNATAASPTDDDGRYWIRAQAPASYRIVTTHQDYETWTSSAFILEGREVVNVTLR